MAAELLLSTLKKPETPLASQPKAVKPPTVTPEPVTGLPPQVAQPLQSTLPSQAAAKSALTWSTEPAINPAFKTPQVSATPQAVTTELPWKGTEGFNPNYTPISDRDAAFGDPSLTREQKNILTQNLLKSKGLDTGAQIPQTDEEQFRIMRENQIAEQTFLDKQIQQGLAKAKRDLEGSRGAIEATVGAVNREGMTSASNQMVATKALEGFNAQFNQLSEQYAEQQRQLRRAQQQENWTAVDRISRNMENTQLALQASSAKAKEEAQGWVEFYKDNGVFDTATPEQLDALAMKHGMDPMVMRAAAKTAQYKNLSTQAQAELDNRIKGVTALTNIFEKGGELNLDDLTSLAGTFNVPMESAISAYQGFNALRNDKSLSNEEKALKGQELRTKLDREMRGITNAELEKVDYISNLYKSGAPQDEIIRAKRVLGIKDEDDPMYRAEVAVKNAQVDYTKSQTQENWAKIQQAQSSLLSLTGQSTGAYLPTQSLNKITSRYEGNRLIIDSAVPMQCGEFVNRFWGLPAGTEGGMGNSIADKEKLVKTQGILLNNINQGNFYNTIKPGMAFVSKAGDTGHTGVVTAVYPDGTFDTMEANIGDNNTKTPDPARPKTRNIKDADLVGFVYPPKGATQLQGQGSGMALNADNMEASIRNSLQGKDAARVNGEVNRMKQYLAQGRADLAKNVVKTSILSRLDTVEARTVTAVENTLNSLGIIESKLEGIKDKDLGYGIKGWQKALGLTGMDDLQLREFQKYTDNVIQGYRKAMSGTAFTEAEKKEYEALFPSLDKTYDQNVSDLETLKARFASDLDSRIATGSGNAYSTLKELNDAFNPQQPAPSSTTTNLEHDPLGLGVASPETVDPLGLNQ